MSAYLGVDLAWGLGTERRAPNETGLAALDGDGRVTDAGWARGVDEVTAWIAERLGPPEPDRSRRVARRHQPDGCP
ncbi:hypothetical protein [Curtobacterium sp. MCPF17_052]|uniref:hypothetical protein n=1 Tax=Curtobacterium sp. MCPF17_052 TaxID=2175655 RepID=UPI0024DF4755|nr:hypothetical protein [Curtobacterium sp. MCPF17_052]WIB12346.1 hypothetical protein DEJ36_16830 [Curtobacterium sp. MCPF17_052]